MITKLNRDKLLKMLESIGWTKVSDMNGYAYRIANHEGKKSNLLLKSEYISYDDDSSDTCFYYSSLNAEILTGDCVSVVAKGKDAKGAFINFYGDKLK